MQSITYKASTIYAESKLSLQPVRNLHAGHFAFMRAIVQGMDATASFNRYLHSQQAPCTPAEVRRTVIWIRDAIAAAAHRNKRPGTARLVMMGTGRLPRDVNKLPALAEFIQAHDLDGFSEAEQIAIYQQRFDTVFRRRRRQERLIARHLAALNWLQQDLPQQPAFSDLLASWLDHRIAEHLAEAQLLTVMDLATRVERLGDRWWKGINAIGRVKADRVANWLRTNLLILEQGTTAQNDRLEPDNAILPLQRLHVPPALDGTHGRLRAPAGECLIGATADIEALYCWIHDVRGIEPRAEPAMGRMYALPERMSNTQRAYWKEVERFYLWLILIRKIALSTVEGQDYERYFEFLSHPPPEWCGRRGHGRADPLWRPFEGPLSPSAQRFTHTVLSGLFRFLVERRYLVTNPWYSCADGRQSAAAQYPARPPATGFSLRPRASRRLDLPAWQIVIDQLQQLPATSSNARLQILVFLLRDTGMRVGQAVRARADDVYRPAGSDVWWLRVVPRSVAETEPVRDARLTPETAWYLERYFIARGLDAAIDAPGNHGAYLLGKAVDAAQRAPWAPCALQPVDVREGIGAGTVRDQLKTFFRLCARASNAQPELAGQFLEATSDWLRPCTYVRRQASTTAC